MTGAHSIHIELLHHEHILEHTLSGDIVAPIWVHLVSISTLDEDRLTIDEELTTRDTYISEAYSLADNLSCRPKL